MHWAVSDIHGCLEEYRQLLGCLQLGADDTLYILGDAADRGPAPMAVLQDVLYRPHTVYIPGNHDYFLRRLGPSYGFTQAEGGRRPSLYERTLCAGWMLDGGRDTLLQFRSLPVSDRRRILAALDEAPAFQQVETAGHSFVLIHKAVPNFSARPRFADWGLLDFLHPALPYDRPLLPDGPIIISGHTWTAKIRQDRCSAVFAGEGHVAIDCGCVFGGCLAAYCLETGEAVYAAARDK